MDAPGGSEVENFHVHNYSYFAIKAFILEVKKYPIIYNGNINIAWEQQLIDFAWARIVSGLLGNNTPLNFEQRTYWNRNFRQFWKWMRWVLEKDMIARRDLPQYTHSPEYIWLRYLKFLEPYIVLSNTSSEEYVNDPDICIQVHSSEPPVDTGPSLNSIFWLKVPHEPEGSKKMYISICIRNPLKLDQHSVQNPTTFPSRDLPCQQMLPTFREAFQSNENNDQQMLHLLPVEYFEVRFDEDYQYIRSLLPMLKELPPNRNTEVKVKIIQALEEVL